MIRPDVPASGATSRFHLRRSWRVAIEGTEYAVVVQYAMLSGFMSIEVDGHQIARGWREWQTVVGGADLSIRRGDHILAARVTQNFGRQDHRFSLSLDGMILPGSDELPTPRQVSRQTLGALLAIAMVVILSTVLVDLVR